MFDGDRVDALVHQHLQLHAEYLALKHVAVTMIRMLTHDVGSEIIAQISPYLDWRPNAESIAFVRPVDELLDELHHERMVYTFRTADTS